MSERSRPVSSSTYVSEKSSASDSAAAAAAGRREPELRPYDTFARQSLMFTGPDGLRNHRVAAKPGTQYIGENTASEERTGALNYLFRPAKDCPFPLAKNGRLGEIGGEVDRWKIKKGI